MNSEELIRVFSSYLPAELAADLVENFNILKRDASLKNLGNSAPGKFVETLVQVLQHLETGKYETAPKVDDYLKNLESRKPGFDDDLKVCTSRIGRAMYTGTRETSLTRTRLTRIPTTCVSFMALRNGSSRNSYVGRLGSQWRKQESSSPRSRNRFPGLCSDLGT